MANHADQPRAIITRLLKSNTHGAVDISIEILELLANNLVGIIGEQGFETLLYRSAHRVNQRFSWLLYDPRGHASDPEFHQLRGCFNGQSAEQASAANQLLLITLVDTLTVLIGEHMTGLIVQPALSRASERLTSKEQTNG